MSRPKRHPTTAATTTAATTTSAIDSALLNDIYPTPSTSPSLVPTRHHRSPSPLPFTSTISSSSSSSSAAHLIKLQQQQAIYDNAHTLPRGATLNIPRKTGSSRIGQSILGQLLAAHSPGQRDKLAANDATLSLETHRPKEQQRRSILPAGWGLNLSKSRTIHGVSLTASHPKHPTATAAPGAANLPTIGGGGPLLPSQVLENPDPSDRLQPVLPSVWLESILSGLSRTDLNTPPHYATLPRVNWHDEQQRQQQQQRQPPVFPGLGPRSKEANNNSKGKASKSTRSAATPSSSSSSSSTLHPKKAQTLHRKSSVCELALGEDARELFQQNRPKTLSSAVISSSIVPMKESLRSIRQRSLDSTSTAPATATATSSATVVNNNNKHVSETSPKHRASLGSVTNVRTFTSTPPPPAAAATTAATGATVKTTRGRFTIESKSALPMPARTRTLSCTSGIVMASSQGGESSTVYTSSHLSPSPSLSPASTATSQQQQQQQQYPRARMDRTQSMSMSLSSPALSHSLPSSRSLNSAFPPSPRLSPSTPSRDHVNGNNIDSNNNINGSNSISSTTSPISIPRAHHYGGRSSHQRSQSSTSSLSRFSQVIIPPPASAASLQFASFSSIGSPSRSSAPSASTDSSSSTWASGNSNSHPRPASVPEKRPNSGGSNNNIRNLSIQIVEVDRSKGGGGGGSGRRQEYEGEPTPVHPLDEDLAALSATATSSAAAATSGTGEEGMIQTHQTMNRVHPNQDFVDSPVGSDGAPLTTSSSMSSSVSSTMGSSLGSRAGSFIGPLDRRASDNNHHHHYHGSNGKHYYEGSGGGFGYDRTSPGSFRPRSLSATNLDSSNSSPSLHQQLSWADRTAMQREGSSHSRSFDTGTPPTSSLLLPHAHSHSSSGGGELSDVVMVKSAKGRMFTVERTIPASPTRSSRFIVVNSTEDMCISAPSPLGPPSLH